MCDNITVPFSETEWFIQAPWGRLSITAWGSCLDPPVLLCHGQIYSIASYRPLVNLLPQKFYYVDTEKIGLLQWIIWIKCTGKFPKILGIRISFLLFCFVVNVGFLKQSGMEIPGHGKSDRFPSGLSFTIFDLVYAIRVVVKHFRWEHFMYIAHSVSTLTGKFYNLSYPGEMTKVIELDPFAIFTGIAPDEMPKWYNKYYGTFYTKYNIHNAPKETAPKYLQEKAIAMIQKNRGLTIATANATLDRLSEPAGNGLVRLTYDQRMKVMVRPPLSLDEEKKLYTSIKTPTLAIVASDTVNNSQYLSDTALDETAYPWKNYRVRQVEGNHDVHVIHPERVAPYVAQFLLYGIEGLDSKSKL